MFLLSLLLCKLETGGRAGVNGEGFNSKLFKIGHGQNVFYLIPLEQISPFKKIEVGLQTPPLSLTPILGVTSDQPFVILVEIFAKPLKKRERAFVSFDFVILPPGHDF